MDNVIEILLRFLSLSILFGFLFYDCFKYGFDKYINNKHIDLLECKRITQLDKAYDILCKKIYDKVGNDNNILINEIFDKSFKFNIYNPNMYGFLDIKVKHGSKQIHTGYHTIGEEQIDRYCTLQYVNTFCFIEKQDYRYKYKVNSDNELHYVSKKLIRSK